jgi:Tfp pilus assembly protein FimT
MTRHKANGYSVLELLFVTALMVTIGGIAVPQTLAALDEFRTAGAARYISAACIARGWRRSNVRRRSRFSLHERLPATATRCFGTATGTACSRATSGQASIRPWGRRSRCAINFKGIDFGALPGSVNRCWRHAAG